MGLNLLDLPVDILYLILRPLLVSPTPIALCPCAGPPAGVRPLPVLLAHPAIHAVACPLLYEGNVFVLDVRGEHGPHVRRCLEEANRDGGRHGHGHGVGNSGDQDEDDDDLEEGRGGSRGAPLLLQRTALQRMGRVEVRIAKLRAWLQDLVVPLLADMAMGGALTELVVYMHSSLPSSSSSTSSSFSVSSSSPTVPRDASPLTAITEALSRPPLTGLVRVLGDPYVRRARLVWVSAAAAASGSGSGSGTSAGAEMMEVEVDWRKALREEDPDGRRLVVGLEPDVRAAARGFSCTG